MPTTLAQLAELVEGRLEIASDGDQDLQIVGAATLDVVGVGEITLADHADRALDLASSAAAAAIVNTEVRSPDKPTIIVDDVHVAFAKVVLHFRPRRNRPPVGISPTATLSLTAQLAAGVEVHPGASIGDDVVIGTGSIVHTGGSDHGWMSARSRMSPSFPTPCSTKTHKSAIARSSMPALSSVPMASATANRTANTSCRHNWVTFSLATTSKSAPAHHRPRHLRANDRRFGHQSRQPRTDRPQLSLGQAQPDLWPGRHRRQHDDRRLRRHGRAGWRT